MSLKNILVASLILCTCAVPAEQNKAKIIFEFEQKSIVVQLNDTDAAQDLIAKLPMVLCFTDYNNTEKIATLSKALTLGNSPTSYKPSKGDLAYYSPWGNLCFFYKDFRFSSGLVPLGTIEKGSEHLSHIDQAQTVTVKLLVQ
ncbi:MAG: cyclophilin-like fold protein [Treponemataceae bacterium]